jgi:hypothetical protein
LKPWHIFEELDGSELPNSHPSLNPKPLTSRDNSYVQSIWKHRQATRVTPATLDNVRNIVKPRLCLDGRLLQILLKSAFESRPFRSSRSNITINWLNAKKIRFTKESLDCNASRSHSQTRSCKLGQISTPNRETLPIRLEIPNLPRQKAISDRSLNPEENQKLLQGQNAQIRTEQRELLPHTSLWFRV